MSPLRDLRAVHLLRVLAELRALGDTQFDALFDGLCLVGPKADEALVRDFAAASGVSRERVQQALEEVDRRQAPERRRDDPASSLPLLPFDRYEEFTPIQAGGMGVVIRAMDVSLRRDVALKVAQAGGGAAIDPTSPFAVRRGYGGGDLTVDRHVSARLVHEALVTSHLEHPGIPAVHEVGRTAAGVPFFAMRLIAPASEPGAVAAPAPQGSDPDAPTTFADRIESMPRGWPAREPLLDEFLRICDTVRFAHSRRILHLDLKPQNVVLGGYGEVVVVDWGMARLVPTPGVGLEDWQDRLREHDDRHGIGWGAQPMHGGTPRYLPPEGRLSEDEPETRPPDASYDVWALGIIFHEVLVGATPFAGARDLVEQRRLVRDQDIPSPEVLDPTVPVGLARLCLRALRRRPAERGSVADLADGVRAWKREAAEAGQLRSCLLRAREALLAARTQADWHRALEAGQLALGEARAIRPTDPRIDAIQQDLRHVKATRDRAHRRRLAVLAAGTFAIVAAAAFAITSRLELQRELARDYGESLGSALNTGFAELVDAAVRHDAGDEAKQIVAKNLAKIDMSPTALRPGWGRDHLASIHRKLADTGYAGRLGDEEIVHLEKAAAIREGNAPIGPEFEWEAAVQWEHNLARFVERGDPHRARPALENARKHAGAWAGRSPSEADSARHRMDREGLESRCFAYESRLDRRKGDVASALSRAESAYELVDPVVKQFEERLGLVPVPRPNEGESDWNRAEWHLARCETWADALEADGQYALAEEKARRGRTLGRFLMACGDPSENLRLDLARAEISAGRRALDADQIEVALVHAESALELIVPAGGGPPSPAALWIQGMAHTLRGRAYLRKGQAAMASADLNLVPPVGDLTSSSRERIVWEVRRLALRAESRHQAGDVADAAAAIRDARACLDELSKRDTGDVESAALRAEIEMSAAEVTWDAGHLAERKGAIRAALHALPSALGGANAHAMVTRVRARLQAAADALEGH